MDYNTTSKYFKDINDIFRYVGFGLLAVGVIFELLNLIIDNMFFMSVERIEFHLTLDTVDIFP